MLRSLSVAVLAFLPLLGAADPQIEKNRARLEQMDADQRSELARALERFEKLAPEKQEELIALDQAIAASDDSAALRATMQQYYEWIKELPVEQRSELRMLAPAERMKQVRELVLRQRREASRSRIIDDFRKTLDWTEAYAEEYERELTELLSEREQLGLRRMPERFRHKRLAMEVWKQWYGDKNPEHPLRPDDWRPFVDQLSNTSRAALDAEQPPVEQWRALINYFAREITKTLPNDQRRAIGGMDRQDRLAMLMRFAMQSRWDAPEVEGGELRKMLLKLPPEERDRLIQLPPEELSRQLRYRYFRDRGSERGPGPPHELGPRPGQHNDHDRWRGHRSGRGDDDHRGPRRGPRRSEENQPRSVGAERKLDSATLDD